MKTSKPTITLKQIRESACACRNPHLFADERHPKEKGKGKKQKKPRTYKVGGRIVSKLYPTQSQEKNHIIQALLDYCRQRCLILFEEYTFTEDRGWRFDWVILSLQVAIEYEGLMSEKSGHTTIKGYTEDTEKYNRASQDGWNVIRFTALNYTTISDELKKL